MYAIETGIEMPAEAPSKYPLGKLDVGQSFLIPIQPLADGTLAKDDVSPVRRSIGVAIGAAGKRTGIKFEAHTVDGGVRVWRTA